MRIPAVAFISIWLLAPHSTEAQLLSNPVQDYINKTTLLNDILSNRRATDVSQQGQTAARPAPDKPPAPPAVDPTTFTPGAGPVLPKLLTAKMASTPAEQQRAEQLFASFVQMYEDTARKDGFPPHDVAYAFEYFVVNTYHTAHDLHDVEYEKDPRIKRGKDMFDRITIANQKKLLKVTMDQERAIYNQLKGRLAEDRSVRAMDDRQKQELTELLAIVFGLNYTMYMKGVGTEDERLTAQARQLARTYLEKITGAPADRIKIGPGGLQF